MKRLFCLLLPLFAALLVFGQDDVENKVPPEDTSAVTWFSQPLVWIAGLVVIIAVYVSYSKWVGRRGTEK